MSDVFVCFVSVMNVCDECYDDCDVMSDNCDVMTVTIKDDDCDDQR